TIFCLLYYFLINANIPATNINIPDKIPKKLIKIIFKIPPMINNIPIKTLFLFIIQLRTSVIIQVIITATPNPVILPLSVAPNSLPIPSTIIANKPPIIPNILPNIPTIFSATLFVCFFLIYSFILIIPLLFSTLLHLQQFHLLLFVSYLLHTLYLFHPFLLHFLYLSHPFPFRMLHLAFSFLLQMLDLLLPSFYCIFH